MKLRFKNYAHDNYESDETEWYLTDTWDFPKEAAKTFAANHSPMHQVEGEFEYDTETDTVEVISAVVNGVKLVPEHSVRVEHPDGGCPACGRGSGPFCYAHDWHNQS
jgi:hypothetical protein